MDEHHSLGLGNGHRENKDLWVSQGLWSRYHSNMTLKTQQISIGHGAKSLGCCAPSCECSCPLLTDATCNSLQPKACLLSKLWTFAQEGCPPA